MWRIVVGAGLTVVLVWLAGFAAFAGTVFWLSGRAGTADCAVMFTGRHGRVLDGLDMLLRAPPRRLLISGYGDGMGGQELDELRGRAPDLFACCVDIEAISRTTADNARQTALWAAHRGCTAVALVTDDEHMPRAWLELRRYLPGPPIRVVAVRHVVDAPPGAALASTLREYHRFAAAVLTGR